jgi:hypothetical protein
MALRVRGSSPPQYKRYQSYKRHLRVDFEYECAYCNIHENEVGGPRFFTVEHYCPKADDKFPHLATVYSNLLYGCQVCNPFKLDDWPSDNPIADDTGYLDPCKHDFDEHFEPHRGFRVRGLTGPGKYMVERLHLNRAQLRKMRMLRRRAERQHKREIELLREFVVELQTALASPSLVGPNRTNLVARLSRVQDQVAQKIQQWNSRWEPIFDMEDYRDDE